MPTQDQLIPVQMGGGLDTKTSPRLVIPGKYSRLENCVLKGGELTKRPGTASTVLFANTIDTGGGFSSGDALFAYDNELVRINNGTTYAYGITGGEWITKPGGGHYATVTKTQVVRNSRTQANFDSAINATTSVGVLGWVENGFAGSNFHIAVFDSLTGALFQTGDTALFSLAGGSPGDFARVRCVSVGSNVLVFVNPQSGGTNTIVACVVDTNNPQTVPTHGTITADTGIQNFDACIAGSNVIVAYVSGTSLKVCLVNGTTGGPIGSPAPVAFAGAVASNAAGVSIATDSNGVAYVAFADTTGVYYLCVNSTTLVTALAKTTIFTASNWGNSLIGLARGSAGQIRAVICSQFKDFGMELVTLSASGVAVAHAPILGTANMVLVSDLFTFDGATVFAVALMGRGATSGSNVMPIVFVADLNGAPIATMLSGVANAMTTPGLKGFQSSLPRPQVNQAGATVLLLNERGRLTYYGYTGLAPLDITPMGISACALTPAKVSSLPINHLGGTVYIGGALPRVYDRSRVVDAGFRVLPDGLTATLGGGGALSTGTYQYRAIYSWTNARGELVRSAVSPPVSVNATSGNSCTVTIPTLPLSTWDILQSQSTAIDVERTTANGTTFYRVSIPGTILNDRTVASLTFADTSVSDAALQANEALYTTGGVYDWLAPPPYSAACVYKNRLVVVGLEDPYEYRISSHWTKGEQVRFNEAWGGRVPASTGPLVACATMDDKLILFTTQCAYVVLGDGPDLLGNNPLSEPQLIQPTVAAGCQSAPSVVSFTGGIIYQAPKGFVLLGRDLSCSYFGADVEAYGQLNVRSAVVLAVGGVEQVRIQVDTGNDAGSNGTCLVFDYHYGQWSTFTSYGAQDACIYTGQLGQPTYVRVRSDGVVFAETPGQYTDSGAFYGWVAETSWLKFAGLEGFQRVKRALVLGAYNDNANLLWEVAYDYSGNSGTPTYAAADAVTVTGLGTYTVGQPFQLERVPRIQKCEAIKFRLSESGASGTGQGIGLAEMSFLVGLKPGRFRGLPQAKRVG